MAREYDPTWGYPSPAPLEKRHEDGFTNMAVAAALSGAAGSVTVGQVAAAEVCAGLWGRAFASAMIAPRTLATEAVTAEILMQIGRAYVLKGESLYEIMFRRGKLALLPATWWSVRGNHNPDSWLYDASFSGPDAVVRRVLPADRVIAPRYASAAQDPWRGRSPLNTSRETSQLASWLEKRLREEAAAQVGRIIALPSTDNTDDLKGNLGQMNGRTVLMPTTAGGWQQGQDATPRRDWTPARVGAEPPLPLVNLRDRATAAVLAACGVPTELMEKAEGAALREAWRQFLHATVGPVANLFQEELREKLDIPDLSISFEALQASDIQGRARAFQSMTGGGMEAERAAEIAGLN